MEVNINKRLATGIYRFDDIYATVDTRISPSAIFEEPSILALERVDISDDARQAFIRHLSEKPRRFGDPFSDNPQGDDLIRAMDKTEEAIYDIFAAIYPTYEVARISSSFRNMRSGPEPMHYDTYDPEGYNVVCAFMNVGTEDRVYKVSYDFGQLVEENPELRGLAKGWKAQGKNISAELRNRWLRERGPGKVWKVHHDVRFPPGSIWFFSPKTIAHQVIYGYGAFCMAWHVNGCGLKSQDEFLASC
jgi:hypothetical protein